MLLARGFACSLLLLIPLFMLAQDSRRSQLTNDPFASQSVTDCGTVVVSTETSDGRAARNAIIELRSMTDGTIAPDSTPVTGNPELDCVPPGRYQLTARIGVTEVSRQIDVQPGPQTYVLQIKTPSAADGHDTISAATLQVPKKAREALRKAREQIAKNDYDGALRLAEQAMKIDPQASDAYEVRGLVRLITHQLPAAMDDLNQSIKLDPSNAQARIMMGAALNDSNDYKQALTALDGARPLAPNSWQENFESGRAYAGMGKLAEAARAFTRALHSNPTFAPLLLARGSVLLAARQFSAAAKDFSEYIHTAPKDLQAKNAERMLAVATAAEKRQP